MNKIDMEELIPIVAELTEKYTSKESTSITYDIAKQLMNAVIYCINEVGLYKDITSLDVGNTELLTNQLDTKALYKYGYDLVVQKVKNTKVLYEHIFQNFNAYGNLNYYDTIIKGMPAFFVFYDPNFNPQNHILTLDYPTLKPINKLRGVDAIFQYLTYIELEQRFLKGFSENLILDLLERYHPDYEELFINISSIVIRNMIGYMIIGKKNEMLKIEESDYYIIKKNIQYLSVKELESNIRELIKLIIQNGYHGDSNLYKYFIADAKDFSFELLNAAENNSLHSIFPV